MPIYTTNGTIQGHQLGGVQFGFGQFNGRSDIAYANDYFIDDPTPRKLTTIGVGYAETRVFSRPLEYTLPAVSTVGGSNVLIEFSSTSGTVTGKIRNDVQHSIFVSINFTLQKIGGCMDFELILTEYPPFTVDYGAVVTVTINNSDTPWYKGEISYADQPGVNKQEYTFRGNGFARYFDNTKAEGTYTADDIAVIVKQMLDDNIFGQTPIVYNPTKLPALIGTTTTNTIEVGKYTLKKILDDLATMAGAIWGVDGFGEFYFQPVSEEIQRVFFVGYDLHNFTPNRNLDNVRNLITVQRKVAKGSGGNGWVVAGVYNDASSVAKYGPRRLDFQGSGYWGQEEADLVGNALLSELKDPQFSAKLEDIFIKGPNEFFPYGRIKTVNAFAPYDMVIADVDAATDWTKSGSGDSAVADATDYFIWADGAVKFTFQTATDDYWVTDTSFQGQPKTLRFYIRASATGSFLRVGFGEISWDEYLAPVDIPITSEWIVIEQDISGIDITHINKFGFQILSDFASSVTVWIDKIEVRTMGNKHYDLDIEKSKYHISKEKQVVGIEAGKIPPRMENYLEGLFAQSGELKYTAEVI